MRRTSVLLDPELLLELESLARRDRRPTAHVIREAMERYVAGRRDEGATALPAFVGIAKGTGDVAARDEEILAAELPSSVAPAGPPASPTRARRARRRSG